VMGKEGQLGIWTLTRPKTGAGLSPTGRGKNVSPKPLRAREGEPELEKIGEEKNLTPNPFRRGKGGKIWREMGEKRAMRAAPKDNCAANGPPP